ncbi:MAG: chorismate synthase [Clostridia bacterium]|nr:chorismate synthase [Clostridia bacterium]
MNLFGNNVRISLFGESHGAAVGCTVDGLPAGFEPNVECIRFELNRRAPHSGTESTQRKETDDFNIVSGILNGKCTGAPLTVLFRNRDVNSTDYKTNIPRPSHADLAARIKFGGFNDPRGGGMFSGRMTLPIVFCGAIFKQILSNAGVRIASHIYKIGDLDDVPFRPVMTQFPVLDPFFPLINKELRRDIEYLFTALRESGNSVGGTVECAALGVPAGIGAPFFNGLESTIAHILFSIPGVHGVEFGAGFGFSEMLGSDANDPILTSLATETNNSGGINGGISNGMPIILRAVFRPVPSISLPQPSVNLDSGEAVILEIEGRHDCCILPRGCSVIEAAVAIALYDAMYHLK